MTFEGNSSTVDTLHAQQLRHLFATAKFLVLFLFLLDV